MVKNPPANAGDTGDVGLIPGLGRSPGGGHSNPLQYSCLENPMERGPCLGRDSMEKEAGKCPGSGEPGLAGSLLDDGPSQVLLVVKNPPANARDMRRRFDLWVGKIPWRRTWQPTPVFLPGESHGQRTLVVYSPWGCKELDTTEVT